MEADFFRAIPYLSRALWRDSEKAQRSALETVSATSLLDLTLDRTVEKTALALLERALREGPMANREALQNPFFRLSPTERMILVALHRLHWGYQRVAKLLGESTEAVAETAWKCRYYLATSLKRGIAFPASGPGVLASICD